MQGSHKSVRCRAVCCARADKEIAKGGPEALLEIGAFSLKEIWQSLPLGSTFWLYPLFSDGFFQLAEFLLGLSTHLFDLAFGF